MGKGEQFERGKEREGGREKETETEREEREREGGRERGERERERGGREGGERERERERERDGCSPERSSVIHRDMQTVSRRRRGGKGERAREWKLALWGKRYNRESGRRDRERMGCFKGCSFQAGKTVSLRSQTAFGHEYRQALQWVSESLTQTQLQGGLYYPVLALSHSQVSGNTERTPSTSCRDWPAPGGVRASVISGAIPGRAADISILMGINIAGKTENIVDDQHPVDTGLRGNKKCKGKTVATQAMKTKSKTITTQTRVSGLLHFMLNALCCKLLVFRVLSTVIAYLIPNDSDFTMSPVNFSPVVVFTW